MSDHPVRLLWSLAGSNLGTTINAAGNSGAYQQPGPPPWTPNALTPVDLRHVDDVWLTVQAATVSGGTPSLTVSLGAFDDQGNLYSSLVSVPALTAAGAAGRQQIAAGRHGASAGTYLVFPAWGQVAWAVSGTTPVFGAVDISLWGR